MYNNIKQSIQKCVKTMHNIQKIDKIQKKKHNHKSKSSKQYKNVFEKYKNVQTNKVHKCF